MSNAPMIDAVHGFVDQDEGAVSLSDSGIKHIAILRRGNVWYHKHVPFHKGVRVVISDEMFFWMEENAVDYTSSLEDREVTGKAKFEYQMNYKGPEPVGTSLDAFEDKDDDKLRRREAYREPYRPPVSRAVPRTRSVITEEHDVEGRQQIVPVRQRTRVSPAR